MGLGTGQKERRRGGDRRQGGREARRPVPPGWDIPDKESRVSCELGGGLELDRPQVICIMGPTVGSVKCPGPSVP